MTSEDNMPAGSRTPAGETCPECGAPEIGGRAGCQALYDELAARAYSDPNYAAAHDLAFDAYCMQHPATYCRSAKSYAAHLTRLCCGIERGGDRRVYAAIQRWLNGAPDVDKPVVLTDRGQLTIVHVQKANSAVEHARRVRAWAEDVWQAYATQHDLARQWIGAALSRKRSAPTRRRSRQV